MKRLKNTKRLQRRRKEEYKEDGEWQEKTKGPEDG